MPRVCGPGFCMAAENASMEVAGSPSTSSMTSPTCIPAFSAGQAGNNPSTRSPPPTGDHRCNPADRRSRETGTGRKTGENHRTRKATVARTSSAARPPSRRASGVRTRAESAAATVLRTAPTTGTNPHRSARFVRAESGGSSVGRLESILKESLPNGTATSFGSMQLFRPMTETEIRDAFRSAMGCAASRARKMPGGAGNRNYWRVHGDDGRSAVVMELPPEPAKSEEVSKEAAAQDLPFLNVHRYLERLGVR